MIRNRLILDAPNLNYLWSELIVEELIRCGVTYFCIAPGSRSAPLISAAARHPKAETFVHVDERGLAFHALGYVSGCGKPAALIVTSGTAAANLLPAVIEASKKKLPLIILTADRPPELQKTGAMQTIEQNGLYGDYLRWEFLMPCPSVEIEASFVLTTVDQAVARAKGDLPGPVHLNCMFRDPLSPERRAFKRGAFLFSISVWLRSQEPYSRYLSPVSVLDQAAAEEVAQRIRRMKNGIIVVGKLKSPSESEAVITLSERTGFPIFPDITSGLRTGCAHPNVIPYFDQMLLSSSWCGGMPVDGVIHIGGRMTSKRFYQFCGSLGKVEYISVLSHPLRNDPLHQVTLRVQADAGTFARSVTVLLDAGKESPCLVRSKYLNVRLGKIIGGELTRKPLNEMGIVREVSRNIANGQGLFLSNSMSIRNMDMYADPSGVPVAIGGNRGASGIDGIIASATGFARGLGRVVTLVIGDMAFLHDLNSLLMFAQNKAPVVIVLVNNDGGGIFSFLPIVKDEKIFEQFIAVPHGLSFEQSARQFNLGYARPVDMPGFIRMYRAALKSGKSGIIECQVRRVVSERGHRALQRKIIEKLS